jgi:hypothetical protein
MALRHFPYKHPTFGTSKNPKTSSHWKVSVYYWWYEYLKRNEDYRKTCAQNGKGKCAKLFEDFGDVSKLEFKQWWTENDRGAVLFAEQPTSSIRVLMPDVVNQGVFLKENTLVLEVPLNLPMSFLVKDFRKVVSKRHAGKRGKKHIRASKILFQATGKVDVAFLEIALMVLDAKKATPKKPFWQIAQDLQLGGVNRIAANDTPAAITDKKNVLAATASRYYRKANEMIKRAGEGRFPH